MKNLCCTLLCLLSYLNMHCNEDQPSKMQSTTIRYKNGENLTLPVPALDDTEEINDMILTIGSDVVLQINYTNGENIETLSPQVCSYNKTLITICNVTSEAYMVNVKLSNKSSGQKYYKIQVYYAAEYSDVCGKTTSVNKTEGQGLDLNIEGFENAERIWWINNTVASTHDGAENLNFNIFHNGLLSIINITAEDWGNYTVNIIRSGELLCTHTYIVTISGASTEHVVHIWYIVLIVVGFIVAISITIFCLIHWCKNKNSHEPVDVDEHTADVRIPDSSHRIEDGANEEEPTQ